MRILVTGGCGYIGSHTIIELARQGHDVCVVDNLDNSTFLAIERVRQIISKEVPFYKVDCRDKHALRDVFIQERPDAVIHFAGLKSVSESVTNPLQYYQNNIDSSLVLCEAMKETGVKKLVFSSTAAVYGAPKVSPIKETSAAGTSATNPYGRSKFMIEQMLKDIARADNAWQITILRYFNPVGAHISGQIGEDPNGTPNNLLPYVSKVAVGALPYVKIFGNDYDTVDGTGVRDYIHVVDLARGHTAALSHLRPGARIYNLGTGRGTSVLELIQAFEKACGKKLPYRVVGRRPGDIASCYADPSLAKAELGWHAEKTIQQACADAWRWQSKNPNGYNLV